MFNEKEWQTRLSTVMPALEGWCTVDKALKLVEVILTYQIDHVVEIGVYGGKSLVPMALAVKEVSPNGRCFGIEAWDTKIAIEEKTSPENDAWWSSLDLIRIKNNFLHYLTQSALTDIIRIIELPVTDSLEIFQKERYRHKIGLIHIDGNHSEKQAFDDVQRAYAILPSGGVIVLDDINWLSLAKAHQWLLQHSDTLFEATNYGIYQVKKSFDA
jgi:predicted O-methyltransferase YrrM